jgi:methylamine dehydrogenase heavy chain
MVHRFPSIACLLGALAVAGAAAAAPPELPNEQVTQATLPAPDGQRIYLIDPALPHLVDGRAHVVDGGPMKYLGLLGTGYAGFVTLSADGRLIYVATTYHSRLQRGTRTDVIEAWRSDDLTFDHEIELPPRRAEALQIRALTGISADGRFLLLQNATPATSVTVVDLPGKRVASEFANPGCWGVLPWPSDPLRLSSVCGDGKLATYELDAEGKLKSTQASGRFFDPDTDPIFMHYEAVGDMLSFVSYHGRVHRVKLDAGGPHFEPPWSLLDAATSREGWRPGGFQLFAIDRRKDLMYVAMHPKGGEGSHKTPAAQLWVVDLKAKRRIARLPGHGALSMAMSAAPPQRLYLLRAEDNRIVSLDLSRTPTPTKPLARSEPVGETPVYLVVQ